MAVRAPQWWLIASVAAALLFALLRRYYLSSINTSGAKKIKGKKKKGRTPSPEPTYDASLPELIVLLGIPGSGKSTWAKQYVLKCDASFTIVSSDEVRKILCGNLRDQTRNNEVWEIVLNQVQGHLKRGRNVILDATNTGTEKRRKFISQLPPCNRFIKVFQVSKPIAKSRISKDMEAGVERTPVPDHVIERMFKQFHDSLLAIKDERWRTR